MNEFTYTYNGLDKVDSVSLDELSKKCHQCSLNKNGIKFRTLLYLDLFFSRDNIKIRSFCSDHCLNKYAIRYKDDNLAIIRILNANMSNEDFINELKKFESLVKKSWMLE